MASEFVVANHLSAVVKGSHIGIFPDMTGTTPIQAIIIVRYLFVLNLCNV